MKQVICDKAKECDFKACPHIKAHTRNEQYNCDDARCTRHGILHIVKCIPYAPVVDSKGKTKKG